jgi:hypothetical protein
MDGSRLTDRVTAQEGRDFSGPGPHCGLERETCCARAGCGPRAVRERAAGRFSYSGQIAAWRANCTVRERAVGRFSYSGRI